MLEKSVRLLKRDESDLRRVPEAEAQLKEFLASSVLGPSRQRNRNDALPGAGFATETKPQKKRSLVSKKGAASPPQRGAAIGSKHSRSQSSSQRPGSPPLQGWLVNSAQ